MQKHPHCNCYAIHAKQNTGQLRTFQREEISVQTSCMRSGGSILNPAVTGQKQQSEQACCLSNQRLSAGTTAAQTLTKNVATAAHMGLNHQGLPKLALPQLDTGHLPAAWGSTHASAECMLSARSHSCR